MVNLENTIDPFHPKTGGDDAYATGTMTFVPSSNHNRAYES